MKFLCLLIINMLSPLSNVAGQTAAPAASDLAVTAEIIGHSYKPAKSIENKPQLILYVKLNVHNRTGKPREIAFYSCGWDGSWITRGNVSFDVWGCDKNYLNSLCIPPRQSIIFYGPIRVRENSDKPTSFALGFVDFTEADFGSKAFRKYKAERWTKLLNARTVYWSNELTGNIDPATTPEVKGKDQYHYYSLSQAGK
jgi:hypothetical protein